MKTDRAARRLGNLLRKKVFCMIGNTRITQAMKNKMAELENPLYLYDQETIPVSYTHLTLPTNGDV